MKLVAVNISILQKLKCRCAFCLTSGKNRVSPKKAEIVKMTWKPTLMPKESNSIVLKDKNAGVCFCLIIAQRYANDQNTEPYRAAKWGKKPLKRTYSTTTK